VRLAVYSDYSYARADGRLRAELPVVDFLAALAEHLEAVTLVGRLDPDGRAARHAVPDSVAYAPLPYYPSLASPLGMAAAGLESIRRFWRLLDRVDAVWLLGPHPLAVAFAALALLRRRGVALGVRQDFPAYVRHRHPARRTLHLAAALLEGAYRLLARRCPVVVVGPDLARRYRGGRRLLEIVVSLVRAEDIAPPRPDGGGDWHSDISVLSVGRLDAEKNPLLMADVLAALPGEHPRWTLVVVGDGALEAPLRERLRARRAADRAELRGYVGDPAALRALYRTSDLLLHCSWTEGVPQVLLEAFAARLPVVATAVGGVRQLADGAALLVPPGDPDAAVRALQRLAGDRELRARLVEAGTARVAQHTVEVESQRVARFLMQSLGFDG
jgi:glycosyltransferase involved in cell wall biosynthesis